MADLVATRAGPGGERREQAAASRPGNGRGSGPVVAVLVVCNGIAWLPAALAALMGQQRAPDRIVVVDVGSVDGSGLLCMRTLGAGRLLRLVRMTRGTSFATAVARGLAAAGGPPAGGFVWLLHDDAAPRPDALENLLLYAGTDPSAAVLGPKIHDWSAPGIVREVGIALDRTARRVTGLAAGERDHGQHDGPRDVPAVSTAGMLVRSGAWTRLGGLSADLVAADDVDFCWRAGRSGLRVVVVPTAVVTHLRAGAAGRRAAATPRSARRMHRRAALFVRLANAPARWLPLIAVHLALVGLGRAAIALVRLRPAVAADELTATVGVLASLRRLGQGRRVRRVGARGGHRVPHRVVRRTHAQIPSQLAPPGWTPRQPGRAPLGRRPDRTWLALGGVLAVVGLATARAGGGFGSTGVAARLLPAPAGAAPLWSAVASGWQGGGSSGLGGPGPAPGWTPVLAVLSTLCGGKPWLALDLILAGGPVLAGLAAWRATGSALPPVRRPVRLAGAGLYGMVPVVTGTIAHGRFDVVVAMVVLPLTLAAAVRGTSAVRAPDPSGAVARVALGAAAIAACSPPLAIPLSLVLLGGALFGGVPRGGAERSRTRLTTGVLAVFVAVGAMLWTFGADVARHPALLVQGYGDQVTTPVTTSFFAAGSRPVVLVAAVVAGVVVLAALVGLTRQRVAPDARAGWAVALVAVAGAAIGARGIAGVRGSVAPDVALAALGLLAAAMVATRGVRLDLESRAFSWRQPAAVILVAAALAAPAVLAAVAVVAPGPPAGAAGWFVPWSALAGPDGGRVLVVTGASPVRYTVVGPAGPRLGDLDQRVPAAARAFTSATVTALVTGAGDSSVTARLVPLGVGAVAVPALASAASEAVVAALDGNPGLVRAQVGRGFLVWRPVTAGPGAGGGYQAGSRLAVVDGAIVRPVGAAGLVPAGGSGRMLVLAEPADRSWRATLAGRPLPARTVSGFAQGFALPPGGGRVLVGYDNGPRRIALGAQAAAELLAGFTAASGAFRVRRRPVRRPM